jgi:hypothetical protein
MRAVAPVFVLAALGTAALAYAEPQYSVSASAFADDAENTSYDLAANVLPNEYLTLSGAIGRSETDGRYADLDGDLLRAAIDVHNARFGARFVWTQWEDSSRYESRTPQLTLYVSHEAWQFGLIAAQRDISIGYTLRTLNGPVDRSFDFSGTGFGASVNWFSARWGAYLEGVAYDYGSDLDRLAAVAGSPLVERFPALEGLVGTILVQAESALDYQASAGIERVFARSTLSLDAFVVKGALDGAVGRSLGSTFRYGATRLLDLEFTIGLNDTDGFDTTFFGGVAITLHN